MPADGTSSRPTQRPEISAPFRRGEFQQMYAARGRLYNHFRSWTHAGLMLAARIAFAHFSVSSAMNLPKPAGDSANTVPPKSAIRAFSLGSARPALISLLSLSMTPTGVPLGAPTPYHALTS